MPLARPAAVSLDLAGTLLHPHPSVGGVYARAAAELGIGVSAAALDDRFGMAFRAADPREPAKAFWAQVVERTFAESMPEGPRRAALTAACWEAFARPEAWRLTRGAGVTLAQLRFLGLKVGFLTNADDRLAEVARAKGLVAEGEPVLSAAGKPDPRAFAAMAAKLGVDLPALVHVGDDPEEDGRGAADAGCRAVVIGDRPADPRVARLARLTGLPELVRSWVLGRPSGRPLRRAERNLLANLGGLPEERGRSSERAVRPLDAAVEEAVRRLGIDRPVPEHAISAAWARLLPPTLARRTAPLRILPDGTLLVHCESSVVRSEAAFHARALAAKVRALPGCRHVKSVGFSLKG